MPGPRERPGAALGGSLQWSAEMHELVLILAR